jgi:hypothetical protein
MISEQTKPFVRETGFHFSGSCSIADFRGNLRALSLPHLRAFDNFAGGRIFHSLLADTEIPIGTTQDRLPKSSLESHLDPIGNP